MVQCFAKEYSSRIPSSLTSNRAARTPDVSNTHVQLTLSALRLRKATDKLRAWSRTATGLLRSKSSLLTRGRVPRHNPTSPDFIDLDQFYRSTFDPLEENGLILVILLDCWTPSGQIGLVPVDKQPAPLVRHHSWKVFAPLLLKKNSAIAFLQLQDVSCKLFSNDVFAGPDRILVFDPRARFTMRVVELGYTYSAMEKPSLGDKYQFRKVSSRGEEEVDTSQTRLSLDDDRKEVVVEIRRSHGGVELMSSFMCRRRLGWQEG